MDTARGSMWTGFIIFTITATGFSRFIARAKLQIIERDILIIGAGVSGLKCANELMKKHKIDKNRIIIVDAQDYVGGRIKQDESFIKGVKIDLGAEILHGSDTLLNEFAKEQNEKTENLFCWAHGDGGPDEHSVNGGYGLYYIKSMDGTKKLLRYDSEDKEFVKTNELLWKLAKLDYNKVSQDKSLHDYLVEKNVTPQMLEMANAGFSNTLCSTNKDLSLKETIRWTKMWDEGLEGDSRFLNTFKCLIDYLKTNCDVRLKTVVKSIDYSGSNGVEICTSDPLLKYRAKCVVCTASVNVLKRGLIKFIPELPKEKNDALQSMNMNRVIKVIVKFKNRVWPKDLHGMIMSGDNVLFPEVWFRDVSNLVATDEEATAYAVGFACKDYADNLMKFGRENVGKKLVGQLEEVFSLLEPRHMSADGSLSNKISLPSPSNEYIATLVKDWQDENPFIGGGYASSLVGYPINAGSVLARPLGNGRIIFAGEATNDTRPGATAHSALETGVRAANEVSRIILAKSF